jgi:hypothetical protein
LETPLPDLLEPSLPAFVVALLQVYAVPPPTQSIQDIHQRLLALTHRVFSGKEDI